MPKLFLVGAVIVYLRLIDIFQREENLSRVNVDIEGIGGSIMSNSSIFSGPRTALWLSLHPLCF